MHQALCRTTELAIFLNLASSFKLSYRTMRALSELQKDLQAAEKAIHVNYSETPQFFVPAKHSYMSS